MERQTALSAAQLKGAYITNAQNGVKSMCNSTKLANYEFMADENSKNLVSIDGEQLPKPISAIGFFAWINREVHPKHSKNLTDGQVREKVDIIVNAVKNGNWRTGKVHHRKPKYKAQGRWDC